MTVSPVFSKWLCHNFRSKNGIKSATLPLSVRGKALLARYLADRGISKLSKAIGLTELITTKSGKVDILCRPES